LHDERSTGERRDAVFILLPPLNLEVKTEERRKFQCA
jgi:hypothetical protein